MNALKKVCNLIGLFAVTAVVILAVLLVGVRLVGLTPYTVLSGSMEPAFRVGSLIYVKKVEPAAVQVGDPISFVVNEELLVATHRVVDIETVADEASGEMVYYYQTKGDANETVDGAPVHEKNLLGVPQFTVPYLGYLSSWLQTREGMFMGASIAAALVILISMPDLLRRADEKDKRAKGLAGEGRDI